MAFLEGLRVPSETIHELKEFVNEWIPHLDQHGKLSYNRVCWYLDSVDGDFLVDWHRDYHDTLFIATAGNGTGMRQYHRDCLCRRELDAEQTMLDLIQLTRFTLRTLHATL
jgi:hypothetical protein